MVRPGAAPRAGYVHEHRCPRLARLDEPELPLFVGASIGRGSGGEGAIEPPAPWSPEGTRVPAGEAIAAEVFPHEEGIEPHDVAADQPQPLPLGQRLERGKRGPEVRAPLVPLVGGIVGHDPAEGRRHVGVVFGDNHARLYHGERFPEVIVVAVDVDGMEIDGAEGAGTTNDLVDVLAREETTHAAEVPRLDRRRIVAKLGLVNLLVAFKPDPAPALAQEIGGVVLQTVAGAELHEAAMLLADASEDLREDAVGVVLGQRAEPMELEPLGIGPGDLLQLPIELGAGKQRLEAVESRAQLRLHAREALAGGGERRQPPPGLAELFVEIHAVTARAGGRVPPRASYVDPVRVVGTRSTHLWGGLDFASRAVGLCIPQGGRR